MRKGWREKLLGKLPSKIKIDAATDCWLWQKATDRGGYGIWWDGESIVSSHLLVYRLYCEAVPDGFQLDHLCRVRSCCNPAHMEPVTGRENKLRGVGFPAQNASKTHCPAGHPYAGENLKQKNDGRVRICVTCDRARHRKRWRSMTPEQHVRRRALKRAQAATRRAA